MMTGLGEGPNRRWLVPEVVQTSAMDCGPAALKCLLEGFHRPVSYGRLREACQTDVDGTSIDVIEGVANQLGLSAEQVMLPLDHVFLPEAAALPAMVVVRQSDGATHFVVIWRRHGRWVQLMDPAIGRRWTTCERFAQELYRHELCVPAASWREWAGSEEFLTPLRRRLALLGATPSVTDALVGQALADPYWLPLAALDASVRMTAALVEAGGIRRGREAIDLARALIEPGKGDSSSLRSEAIPVSYWSVVPDAPDADGEQQLRLRGAVLMKVKGLRSESAEPTIGEPADEIGRLTPELAALLTESPVHPGRELWRLLKADGLLAPVALMGALAIAVGAVLVETLLFRGLFDIAWELKLASQRLGAVTALIVFVGLMLLMEIPIAMESLRLGRHFETRLRMALLEKLPKLSDRYFQSRPISDMAERSHSIYLTRWVASLGIQFTQTLWDLLFTLLGIAIIDPASTPLALTISVLAVGIPMLAQPLLNERDLRVRSHSGALHNFYLDALLGLVPVRTHSAERPVRREHEGLLVEWARSSRSLVRVSLLTEGLQAFTGVGLAGLLLINYFQRSGVTGGVLLLVFWALKLPAIGHRLALLAHQYPAQRNILLRLLEPLATPEEPAITPASPASGLADAESPAEPSGYGGPGESPGQAGVGIGIERGRVVVSGHTILQDVELMIAPGQHVAIVGSSGAGKSTLIGILLGWHRLAEGELRIDGRPLYGEGLAALRSQTAWVDPAIQIWNRSFLDNLCYSSSEDSLGSIGQALASADLRAVLQNLPLGLQTPLGESGALVSGGEGQRVRLGRAMLQPKTRLALLDEPFRGLDRHQRRKLLGNARRWWSDATLLCVTHDVAETLSFDRVLVIERGQIVEDGSPDALKNSASRYRQLLDAEAAVTAELWQADWWRRIEMREGRALTTGGAEDL
jgi:ABC-type bacteriocin/lantibiotic exporter with double-glycine peptidase domain